MVYVWGLLGPVARIDLRNPAGTRYYVLDGFGHAAYSLTIKALSLDVQSVRTRLQR
ncbi:MAG: hypothetical protein ACUVRT_02760 [Armatimonadota bacterium]